MTAAFRDAYPNGAYTSVSLKVMKEMNLFSKVTSVEDDYTAPIRTIESMQSVQFPGNTACGYTNMIYALVPYVENNNALVDMTFKTFASSEATMPVWTLPVGNAPVRANYRTNVFGNLFTKTNDFQVQITPAFTEAFQLDMSQKLTEAIAKAPKDEKGVIQLELTEDFGTAPLVLPAAEQPTEIDLNLNGHTLPPVTVGKNYTLNLYNDVVSSGLGSSPAAARRRIAIGETRISKFTSKSGSHINFYGGEFAAKEGDQLLVKEEGGDITIHGGNFYGQDVTEFVAPGSSCFLIDGWYCVSEAIRVSTVEQLRAAIAEANVSNNTKILVVEDLTLPSWEQFTFTGVNTTFAVAKDKTLTLHQGGSLHASQTFVIAEGASVTFTGKGTIKDSCRFMMVEGKATIEDGIYSSNDVNSERTYIWVNGGELTMNGGEITNYVERAISNGGKFTMNGGRITSYGQDEYAVADDYQGNPIGTYIHGGVIWSGYGALSVCYAPFEISGGDFVVAPTYVLPGDGSHYYALDYNGQLNGVVSGGRFFGSTEILAVVNNEVASSQNVRFTGGYFGGDFFGVTLPEGYQLESITPISSPYELAKDLNKRIVPSAAPAAAKRRR